MLRRRSTIARVLFAAALLSEGGARADEPSTPPPSSGALAPPPRRYSRYERESVEQALTQLHGALEPHPEGKIIERIDVLPREVFEQRDPIPRVLNPIVNWFHVTTKPYVIEREVLLRVGDRWVQAIADETARNLRTLQQLSLVLVVPMKGSAPGRVRMVVITKDVWSLRLNSDFRVAGGGLEYLLLQPSETNLFGTQQSVSALFVLQPDTLSFGARYTMPRVAGSRIRAIVDANVLVNRSTGAAEGSYGSFTYGQPLWSTRTPWAWQGTISWRQEITRRYVGNTLSTYDAPITEGDDKIPWVYRSDRLSGSYQVTRSFGWMLKHDITFGASASRRVFRTRGLGGYPPAAVAEFVRNVVPVSDTKIGPYVEYHTYSNRFVTVLDLNTLGLQEDIRVGHEAYLRVEPVLEAIGSSRNLLDTYAAAAYTVPLGDGIARAYVEAYTELQTSGIPQGSIEVGGRLATPRMLIGRLHFDARVLNRYRNYLNLRSTIGGDTRPRGYPSKAFVGEDVVAASLEFRSRPVELFTVQIGGAAFFDTGDAFDGFDQMRLKQSAGFGARFLLPQFDKVVLRVDWGFPLTPGVVPPGGFPGEIVVTFRQAFPMPTIPVE